MIVHIAIFKWKSEVTKEEVEKVLADVRALKAKCKGVIDIICGENFSRYSEGFTHAIVVLAEDQKALVGYRNHTLHQALAEEIEEMEERGIGMDFHT
ncbi:MAG TPA: Dabb family protein [archaeon]|nr:Dabb family protein [archaeon]